MPLQLTHRLVRPLHSGALTDLPIEAA